MYSSDFEWDKQAAKSPERWIKNMSSDAVMLIIILLISVQNFWIDKLSFILFIQNKVGKMEKWLLTPLVVNKLINQSPYIFCITLNLFLLVRTISKLGQNLKIHYIPPMNQVSIMI